MKQWKEETYPEIPNTGSRFSINMISVIRPRGELRFKTIEGTTNTNTNAFIGFLKVLVQDSEKPIFLILDTMPAGSGLGVYRRVMFAYFVSG